MLPVGSSRRGGLTPASSSRTRFRDILLRAAELGLYEVRWSATTLDEVERILRNRLLANYPDRAARVGYLLTSMRGACPLAGSRF